MIESERRSVMASMKSISNGEEMIMKAKAKAKK